MQFTKEQFLGINIHYHDFESFEVAEQLATNLNASLLYHENDRAPEYNGRVLAIDEGNASVVIVNMS